MTDEMIGKTVEIAGMVVEIVSDGGDSWRCRNLTTKELLDMKKGVIEKAIKLGQAEIVSNQQGHP